MGVFLLLGVKDSESEGRVRMVTGEGNISNKQGSLVGVVRILICWGKELEVGVYRPSRTWQNIL